jgi:hypothetical protein
LQPFLAGPGGGVRSGIFLLLKLGLIGFVLLEAESIFVFIILCAN